MFGVVMFLFGFGFHADCGILSRLTPEKNPKLLGARGRALEGRSPTAQSVEQQLRYGLSGEQRVASGMFYNGFVGCFF